MPFIEIKKPNTSCIKIRPDGKILITKDLRNKHFFINKSVGIFYDEENLLLGLKPVSAGYKFSDGTIKCRRLPDGVDGEHEVTWSEKHEMLIIDLNE